MPVNYVLKLRHTNYWIGWQCGATLLSAFVLLLSCARWAPFYVSFELGSLPEAFTPSLLWKIVGETFHLFVCIHWRLHIFFQQLIGNKTVRVGRLVGGRKRSFLQSKTTSMQKENDEYRGWIKYYRGKILEHVSEKETSLVIRLCQ